MARKDFFIRKYVIGTLVELRVILNAIAGASQLVLGPAAESLPSKPTIRFRVCLGVSSERPLI